MILRSQASLLVLGLAVVLAAAPGCTIDALDARKNAPPPTELPRALAEPFAYAKAPVLPRFERVEEDPTFVKLRGRYENAWEGKSWPVTFEYWRSKIGTDPHPVVVIVPILAGRYPECDYLGRLMARNGMHAFFVWREDNLLALDLAAAEPFQAKLRRSVVNIRRTLDWVCSEPDVAKDRVGLVGISLGAIAGSIVMAVEPRIKRGVLIMGGGDLPGIMCDSIETPVRRYKLRQMHEHGYSEAEFRAAVRRSIPSDPLDYAPYVGATRVQQFISKYDNKVPTPYQWKLWEALGRPEGFAVPIGHYTAILYLGFAEKAAVAFMTRGLAPAAAPAQLAKRIASAK